MVLSNKKLKQKLRAAIAESLSSSAASEPDLNHNNTVSTNPDPNPNLQQQPHSLKQLLDSVTQKPRLSKREKKRRRTLETGSETAKSNKGGDSSKDNEEVDEESKGDGDDKKGRRRKRNDEESKNLELAAEDDDGEESKNLGVENIKRKKKKEKRKREEEEGGSGEEIGVVKEANNLKKNKKKKKQQKKKKKEAKNEEDNKAGDELVGNEKPNQDNDSQLDSYAATKVYVGGIPYIASENDIKRYFEGCGTINEIDYMTFPDSGKFRGIAIISFRTEGAAKRALALDGSEMDGLFLKIQPYKGTRAANKASDFAPKIVEGYNRIYVGNLSWDITEEDLRKLLADCKISSIRFGKDKETGEFRGYAHVDFSDSLSLSMALKLDQEIVCGRPVKISCAVPKKGENAKSRSAPASNVVTSNGTDNAGLGAVTSNGTDNAGLAAVSGKIRRRTCYECGEKGHLSSACPKKTADPSNSNTS